MGSNKKLLTLLLTALLLVWAGPYAVKYLGADNPAPPIDSTPAVGNVSASTFCDVGRAMARGDFELARQYADQLDLSDTQSQSIHSRMQSLLDSYDGLMGRLQDARKKAYQEYLNKVHEQVQQARWRKSLLDASVAYEFKLDDKGKLEDDLREKIQENWLESLVELVKSHDLAEKMNLKEDVDPVLYDEIIARGLEIAKDFESKDEGLEAYSKVYYPLTLLDRQKYQYDELHRRLLRQAMLRSMYVPDPNTEGVSWQERRDGVTSNMIREALAVLESGYAEKPDFHEMALQALENCLLLAETDKLNQTFKQLDDAEAVKFYKEKLSSRLNDIRETPERFAYRRHVISLLDYVISVNEQSLKFPREVIMAEFAEGAFSAVDEYTYMVWPADKKEFYKNMTNEFTGVGIIINKDKEGFLKVASLVSRDASAYQAGLDADDTILKIDGKDAKTITLEKAVTLITGPPGTKVMLTIDREGFDQPRDFSVTRRPVVVPTIKGLYREAGNGWQYLLDPNDGIAYVHMAHFSGTTTEDLKLTLSELKKQNMQALILDLRNNPGGYRDGAVEVVDMFVSSEGETIISCRYRNPRNEEFLRTTKEGTFDGKLPMAILIDSDSASASEIVAGALKDHNRAVIVGTRSHGKGNVQTIQPLNSSDAEMKMTIAYYYLPNGRRVHHDPKDKSNEDYGVIPNVNLELTIEQFMEFYKARYDAEVLHQEVSPEHKKTGELFSTADYLKSDPQLQMALLVMRARLWVESLSEFASCAAN